EALLLRMEKTSQPLNIIACENMVGGSEYLQSLVLEKVPEEKHESFMELYGFPNAAVDRIVPNQNLENILDVAVEPYFEWVVDRTMLKGSPPEIAGMTLVKDLQPYIERKL